MTQSIILLTAAVAPGQNVAASLTDVEERRRQYETAWPNWLAAARSLNCSLWMVETTGSRLPVPLGPSDRLLAFQPPTDAHLRGKGALEACALDFAIAAIGDEYGPYATVHKATGRLTLNNAARILEPQHEGILTVRRTLNRSYCDTRVFSVTPALWSNSLSQMDRNVDDDSGKYLEHVMAKRIVDAEFDERLVVRMFNKRPDIRGQAGWSGKTYDGRLASVRAGVGSLLERRLMPRLSSKQF